MAKSNGADDQLNFIGQSTSLEGTLKTDGNMIVHGKVKGSINCNGLFSLGENGIVEGDVAATDAIISGKIIGTLVVKNKITLESKSHFKGELNCARLAIDEGAKFEGKSDMSDNSSKVIKNEAT